jgi:undecaprenyl-phosphate 4-deoxy-4-formamido-L-arabinose transferase
MYDRTVTQVSVSVVIPVYNSREILPTLSARLVAVLDEYVRNYEVILVNDGSPDGSWSAVQEAAQSHSRVRGLNLMRNYGQHNALLAGIREAKGDLIVTMDDDLQHPPDQVPRLIEALSEDLDVVYGTPQRQQHGLLRDAASFITKLVLTAGMGADTAQNVSALRVFRTGLRRAFADYRGPNPNLDVMLTWATGRFSAIEVRHEPRASGESGYTVGKLVKHALNMLTGFSILPLRLASYLGFASAALGVLVLMYVVGRFFIEKSVPGFPFLASIIAIFGGVQLFATGIIGEYLGRVHMMSLKEPTYVVAESTGDQS